MTREKFEMTKGIGKIALSFGVGTVIDNIIRTTLPGNAGRLARGLAWLGSIGLGFIAADQVSDAVDSFADDLTVVMDVEIEDDEDPG